MKTPTSKVAPVTVTRELLLTVAKETPGARVGLKIAAILLLLEGQRCGWIAEVLGLTRQSLNLWVHKLNAEGVAALKDKPRPGRPARLTATVRQRLEIDLEKAPLEVGLNRVQWDGPTLAVYLKRQLGVTLKVRQAQNWLHQLGYRLKRAGYSYLQASAKDARRFRTALKKTPQPGAS